jgi:MFS family permease
MPPPDAPAIIEESRLDVFKHWARRVTLASIFGNAVFGIWAVAGPLDDLGAAALATSLLLTAAGVTSVACAAAIPERRIGWLIPLVGILAALVGYALLIGAAWNDFDLAVLWRLGGSLVSIAVAIGFASLLSDAHLTGRYRRLLWTAYLLVASLAVFLIAFLWGWTPGQGWRLFGVLAVLLGAITIAAPVVERLRPDTATVPEIRHCPYCGGIARARGPKARCTDCHRRFQVSER